MTILFAELIDKPMVMLYDKRKGCARAIDLTQPPIEERY